MPGSALEGLVVAALADLGALSCVVDECLHVRRAALDLGSAYDSVQCVEVLFETVALNAKVAHACFALAMVGADK